MANLRLLPALRLLCLLAFLPLRLISCFPSLSQVSTAKSAPAERPVNPLCDSSQVLADVEPPESQPALVDSLFSGRASRSGAVPKAAALEAWAACRCAQNPLWAAGDGARKTESELILLVMTTRACRLRSVALFGCPTVCVGSLVSWALWERQTRAN